MARAIEGRADLGDATGHSGRGLVVDHRYCADAVLLVGGEARLDRGRVGAVAPVAGDELDGEAEPLGHLPPQRGEVAGLAHQDLVARRQRVHQRRFPRAGSGRGIDDHRALGVEDALQARQDLLGQLREVGPAVIEGGPIDRAQHPVGHVGRAGDLEEVAPAAKGHLPVHCGLRFSRKARTPSLKSRLV